MKFDVAFFGNSITSGSDFQRYFPNKKIINLGYPGNSIIDMQRRICMLQAVQPQKIFIMAGTNDLVHIDIEDYKQRYSNLIVAIKDSIPNAKIYIQSVLPSNHEMANYAPNEKVKEANKVAKNLAEKFQCQYIDLYGLYADEKDELPKDLTKDGVHLYPKSYKRWTHAIAPYIEE